MLALGTARGQFATAARAEVEPGLDRVATLRAEAAQGLAQDEIKDDAERVGNTDGDDGPEQRAHAAAFGVAVDIADEQEITACAQAGGHAKQGSSPGWGRVVMMHESDIEKPLRGDEHDSGKHPGPRRNNLDFRAESLRSFVI